jgi:ankyrin repeat protein
MTAHSKSDAPPTADEAALILDAAKNKDMCFIDSILAYYSSDALDGYYDGHNTLLTTAAWKGYIGLIERLLAAGADINIGDSASNTPLILSIAHKKEEATDLLLERGAALRPVNGDNYSALDFALMTEQLELFEKLIDAGADGTRWLSNGGGGKNRDRVILYIRKSIKDAQKRNTDFSRGLQESISLPAPIFKKKLQP